MKLFLFGKIYSKTAQSIGYIDTKTRIVRAVNIVTTFIKTSIEFKNDQTNVVKRAKMSTMINEINDIR